MGGVDPAACTRRAAADLAGVRSGARAWRTWEALSSRTAPSLTSPAGHSEGGVEEGARSAGSPPPRPVPAGGCGRIVRVFETPAPCSCMPRLVRLLPDATLTPLQGSRLDACRQVTALVAECLGATTPRVQVVRDSVTGVWGTSVRPVVNLAVEDLDTLDSFGLVGVLAHEVGHVAAGHLDDGIRPRRRRRRLEREMEANSLAANAVGVAPLVAAYLAAVNWFVVRRGGKPLTAEQVVAGEAWRFPEADSAAELLRRVTHLRSGSPRQTTVIGASGAARLLVD